MVVILTTFSSYMFLFIEYFLLYPDTERWIEYSICIVITLVFVMWNTLRQTVWIAHPKMKRKNLVNLILLMNLLTMILVFMVDVIWKLLARSLLVGMFLSILMGIHILLVILLNQTLKQQNLVWKKEFLILKEKTIQLEKSEYETYLNQHSKFHFYFIMVYLFNPLDWLSPIIIILYSLYGIFSYHQAWKKGCMAGVIKDSEKWYYGIVLVITSVFMICLDMYIPKIIGMIILSLSDLVLRLFLQRYTTKQLR